MRWWTETGTILAFLLENAMGEGCYLKTLLEKSIEAISKINESFSIFSLLTCILNNSSVSFYFLINYWNYLKFHFLDKRISYLIWVFYSYYKSFKNLESLSAVILYKLQELLTMIDLILIIILFFNM